jgi:predicted GIY-YIG superfamily endonuclease
MNDRFFRRELPESTTAVYFVVSKKHGVIYIGQTKNLVKRWYLHDQTDDALKLGDCRLHWLVVPVSELLTTERAMKKIHKPPQSERRKYEWHEGPTQLDHDLGRFDTTLNFRRCGIERDLYESNDDELAVIREIMAIFNRLDDPRQKQRIARYVLDRVTTELDNIS